MRHRLEQYFQFQELGTTWRTEILAGCTTFVTMAYIIFVNPSILHETGMPVAAVTAATCLASALGCFLMGALARYPIALAPGMGLNAYFWIDAQMTNTVAAKDSALSMIKKVFDKKAIDIPLTARIMPISLPKKKRGKK